jgi:hypothetical protein
MLNKIVKLSITAMLLMVIVLPGVSMASGMLVQWGFDENTNDSSGNSRNLSLISEHYEPGVVGQALSFSSDDIENLSKVLASINTLTLGKNATVSFFLKKNDVWAHYIIVAVENYGLIEYKNDKFVQEIKVSDPVFILKGIASSDDAASMIWTLGDNDGAFSGAIDDFRVYDYALELPEISLIKQSAFIKVLDKSNSGGVTIDEVIQYMQSYTITNHDDIYYLLKLIAPKVS